MDPRDFHSLFSKAVPRSLINCIRDLLRYDPEKRLTSRQCREHPYLQETLPRNHIVLPHNLFAPAPQRSIPPSGSHVNGSQSHPSLVPPPHAIPNQYSHSAQNLHHLQQFPNASSTHRTPYPLPQLQPNSFSAHHRHQQPQNGVSDSSDYPMSSPSEAKTHINGHPVDYTAMVQDPNSVQDASNVPPAATTNGSKFGKRGLPFGKKHGKWGLGMFTSEKSHHPLPPVDETSPAITFTSRKRSQSDGSDNKSIRHPSPVHEQLQDSRDAKKINKKEAQRLHREAELEKRKLLEKNAREQARAVLLKRQKVLLETVDDPEWGNRPKPPSEAFEHPAKQPSTGPLRRDHPNGNGGTSTLNAAAGKFAIPTVNENLLVPPEPYRDFRGPPPSKARRREYDDDHSMSSSDVHSLSRMSSTSFVTVDSDPGPSRLRNRPSFYGIRGMTSRSSLRTSFDDFSPSARSSNSFSLEGQLVYDFKKRASVTSSLSGNVSPPPIQMLSLSPTISPPLSPSPPWIHPQQQKDDLLARTQSPPFFSISPLFHNNGSIPHTPVEVNGHLSSLPPSPYGTPYGYSPSPGHTPKSSKSVFNPMFKVVSFSGT
jgi:hypothetical protein